MRLQPNQPQNSTWPNNVAGGYRRLGRWREAIAAKRRSPSVDAWWATHQGARLPVIRAWAGDKDALLPK